MPCTLGSSAACIPFINHNGARRSRKASSMLKQARPRKSCPFLCQDLAEGTAPLSHCGTQAGRVLLKAPSHGGSTCGTGNQGCADKPWGAVRAPIATALSLPLLLTAWLPLCRLLRDVQGMGPRPVDLGERADATCHVLHYPQQPLVRSSVAEECVGAKDFPNGQNAIVAILCNGSNQVRRVDRKRPLLVDVEPGTRGCAQGYPWPQCKKEGPVGRAPALLSLTSLAPSSQLPAPRGIEAPHIKIGRCSRAQPWIGGCLPRAHSRVGCCAVLCCVMTCCVVSCRRTPLL